VSERVVEIEALGDDLIAELCDYLIVRF